MIASLIPAALINQLRLTVCATVLAIFLVSSPSSIGQEILPPDLTPSYVFGPRVCGAERGGLGTCAVPLASKELAAAVAKDDPGIALFTAEPKKLIESRGAGEQGKADRITATGVPPPPRPTAADTREIGERPPELAGVPADAMPGTAPLESSNIAPAASEVRAAQSRLARLGYDPGAIDGFFGPKTAYAIQQFQTARGLQPTGRLGGDDLAHLYTPPTAATDPRARSPRAVTTLREQGTRNHESRHAGNSRPRQVGAEPMPPASRRPLRPRLSSHKFR